MYMNTGVFGDIRLKSRATACFSMSLNIQQFFFFWFSSADTVQSLSGWKEESQTDSSSFVDGRVYRTQELIVAKERKKEREKELAVVIQEWVSFLPVDILRLKREHDG